MVREPKGFEPLHEPKKLEPANPNPEPKQYFFRRTGSPLGLWGSPPNIDSTIEIINNYKYSIIILRKTDIKMTTITTDNTVKIVFSFFWISSPLLSFNFIRWSFLNYKISSKIFSVDF